MSSLENRKRAYGCRRDALDHRDLVYRPSVVSTPAEVDLFQWFPPVMDQGQLGSCTAHGITTALRFDLLKQKAPDQPLSRLQLYYDEREIEGTTNSDAGAEIRDGIKSVASRGVAKEALWPYNIDVFYQKPFPNVYAKALKFRALEYQRVGDGKGYATAQQIKVALATGFPVVFGFSVFAQFESDGCARTGLVEMPSATDKPIGAHCTVIGGYGQKTNYFKVRNSWGSAWGEQGNFYLPYDYVEQQGSDFWIITKLSV